MYVHVNQNGALGVSIYMWVFVSVCVSCAWMNVVCLYLNGGEGRGGLLLCRVVCVVVGVGGLGLSCGIEERHHAYTLTQATTAAASHTCTQRMHAISLACGVCG